MKWKLFGTVAAVLAGFVARKLLVRLNAKAREARAQYAIAT